MAFSWWDQPDKQRIQGLFREAIAEVGIAPPPDVPAGHSNLRFSDTAEFRKLLVGAGLDDVRVEDHATTYAIADVDTLLARRSRELCGDRVGDRPSRTPQHRRPSGRPWSGVRRPIAHRAGLVIPVAFKIGSGQKA